MKRVSFLYEKLFELKFTDEQIERVIQELLLIANARELERLGDNQKKKALSQSCDDPLSLEVALDWLCLHLPSEELPPLFTEVNLRDQQSRKSAVTDLTVIKGVKLNSDDGSVKDTYVDDSMNSLQKGYDKRTSQENLHSLNRTDGSDDCSAAEKRTWLLERYQYEDDDDYIEKIDLEVAKLSIDAPQQSGEGGNLQVRDGNQLLQDVDSIERHQSAEVAASFDQRRLEKIEKQIKENQDILLDDVGMYMRSKYETAEIRKQLKKLEGQAKGLRSKMSKQQTKQILTPANDINATTEFSALDNQEEDEYIDCDLLGVFQRETDNLGKEAVRGSVNQLESIDYSLRSESSSIPKTWTGKTPKGKFVVYFGYSL